MMPPNKDFADLFADRGEGTRKLLEDLKGRAIDGLELAIEPIPNEPSKRRRLGYVRENIIPLLLKEREEEKGLAALMEATKDSRVLAALDDVAAATELKLGAQGRARRGGPALGCSGRERHQGRERGRGHRRRLPRGGLRVAAGERCARPLR